MLRQVLEELNEGVKNDGKEWEYALNGWIPLTPSILKQFEKKVDAYHLTSFDNMEKLYKLQNKRKDISAFTKGSDGLVDGALSDSEVLFELEGLSSFHSPKDMQSNRDRNGLRWISNEMEGDYDYFIRNNFSVKMWSYFVEKYNLSSAMDLNGYVKKLDGKGKAEFIKEYYDLAKKLLTKDFIEKIYDLYEKMDRYDYDNDEILLHNFKIKGWYIIVDYWYGDEEDREYEENRVKKNESKFKKFMKDFKGYIVGETISKIRPDKFVKVYKDFEAINNTDKLY